MNPQAARNGPDAAEVAEKMARARMRPPRALARPIEMDEEFVLRKVRERSCYRTLRGLIETTIKIGYGLCLFFFLLMAMGGAFAYAEGGGRYPLPLVLSMVTSALTAGLGIVLLKAAKEGLLLLIDGVDLMVAERMDRMKREQE